ncbi:ubiquitin-conjugating enzyme E2 U [Octodon degus]|uniref:Ubiquitin-conjugating enzyme E2 U n=1 Tax=Octodon degus TaxID=10160 RepID=A0A6P6EP11_OCTDE|nr:ubiquitin-conjugating enzyme E2 U [Octodon degus]
MYSRAYSLLQRDFRELMRKSYKGITASPISEDMMQWKADIQGLQNSPWQGLVFELAIHFTPDYNFVPPAVRFVTIPFHPNVDPDTGEPCIDFLNNSAKWNSRYTLGSILLALQVMLSNPGLENPVNLEAAQMLNEDQSMYEVVLQRLFQRSLQSEEGCLLLPKPSHELVSAENRTKGRVGARQVLNSQVFLTHHRKGVSGGAVPVRRLQNGRVRQLLGRRPVCSVKSFVHRSPLLARACTVGLWGSRGTMEAHLARLRSRVRPSRVISFDDYHKTWCGIATSKATESHRRPLLEDPDLTRQYSKWREKDLRCSEEWKLKFAATRSRCARERRAPAMASPAGKRTHACPSPEELPPGSQPEAGHSPGTGDPEDDSSDEDLAYNYYKHNSWEDEVDDLVAWADALDTDALEDWD